MADPSESVSSADILDTVYKYFNVVEERSFGGNILMSVFKDIAYHFVDLTAEKQTILNKLFKIEDDYLKENKPDFLVGFYKKK